MEKPKLPTLSIIRDPRARCEWVFGSPMNPCPKCQGYNLIYQTPIKMDTPISESDGPRQILGKFAKQMKREMDGTAPLMLEGPVYVMCRDCGHRGPTMDCSGRTRADVGQDKQVARTIKSLWNSQPQPQKQEESN